MGVTVAGRTVSSKTVEQDDSDIASRLTDRVISPGAIVFANGGTSPAIVQSGSRYNVTWGTGSPTAGATVTIPHRMSKTPKVWIKSTGAASYYIVSVDGTNIVVGVKNAPVASAADTFELIVE